jgi:hypothetical protein
VPPQYIDFVKQSDKLHTQLHTIAICLQQVVRMQRQVSPAFDLAMCCIFITAPPKTTSGGKATSVPSFARQPFIVAGRRLIPAPSALHRRASLKIP